MSIPEMRPDRSAGWTGLLSRLSGGLLVYLLLTGLPVRLLPFGAWVQWSLLLHTVVGVLALVPVGVYLARHWRAYLTYALTPNKVLGYAAFAAVAGAALSGVWATVLGAGSDRVPPLVRTLHLGTSLALLVLLVAHLVPLLRLRASEAAEQARLAAAKRRYLVASLALPAAALLVAVPLARAKGTPRFEARFPDGYETPWGKDRPFAPSLARTKDGRPIDPRELAGSASCGTSGCHREIYAEWSVSAHRWAALDPAFQRVQTEMAKQNGPESTRYCGGCHDPISLFSGAKMVFAEKLTGAPGLDEGVSCLTCHSVRQTDLEGNANYVVAPPERYLFETDRGPAARLVSEFLIRTYPAEHTRSLSKRLFKTPEYCAACHKQFVDQEINRFGWVQLQNQYDNWRKSHWNHGKDATKTVECRECHMPLHDSHDPARGDDLDYNRSPVDGKHRSHRFLASNQMMPVLLDLPGGKEQSDLTVRWLEGKLEIPEIRDKWAEGNVVEMRLEAPERAEAGKPVALRAVLHSNKVGHDFPTGPLDLIQSWVELTVKDASGAVVYTSGIPDDRKIIPPGTFMFKAEPVDRFGNLIDRHNLWEMVGVRYRRSLFPGHSDAASYGFTCPGTPSAPGAAARDVTIPPLDANGPLTVTARLRYRKLDQFLVYFLFGQDTKLSAPIVELARAEARIEIAPPASSRMRTGG